MYETLSQKITDEINNHLHLLREQWYDKDVVIPVGYYKGRKGRVTHIGYTNNHGICFEIRPYEYERRDNQTIITDKMLWDHPDARSFWPTNRFKALQLWDAVSDENTVRVVV